MLEGACCAARTDSLYKADYVSYLKGSVSVRSVTTSVAVVAVHEDPA